MQENNQTFSDFCRRTDYLAASLGLNLSEIPEKIGISKAMLYAYRSGKNRITNKVWIGLEAAEAAAAADLKKRVNAPHGALLGAGDAETSANPNEQEKGAYQFIDSDKLMEDAATYSVTPRAEVSLARIAAALEEIARKLPDHLQL